MEINSIPLKNSQLSLAIKFISNFLAQHQPELITAEIATDRVIPDN
ncbi:hypothetical protein OAL23_00500 [bacterium]|nr:hypothetical protein [bacterium]